MHQENQGLSGARNTGIDMARGRYYAFIDSDDVVRPAYLKKMYEACEAHDAYMAICAVEDVQENGKPLPEPVFTPPRHLLHRCMEQALPRRGVEAAALPGGPSARG